jgi:hypothetical protein
MAIHHGFSGILDLDGTRIRCTDFSPNIQQEVSFYDHAIGLNDTNETDEGTKGEAIGTIQTQKRIWRPGTILPGGSASFPATNLNVSSFFTHAKYGTEFTVIAGYYCDTGGNIIAREYKKCRINTFGISVTAEDIVQMNVDFVGKEVNDVTVTGTTTAEKLITWDKVSLTSAGFSGDIQQFELEVNNSASPIYTALPGATGSDLLPKDIRLGVQEVTGSVTVYDKQGIKFLPLTGGDDTIDVVIDSLSFTLNCVFKPLQISGQNAPIITSIPFAGIDKAFGA